MTQTITIEAPGIGYYEADDGTVIGKFDLEPGEHDVGDGVASVVQMTDRQAWRDVQVDTGVQQRDWEGEWANATTVQDKLDLIGERFFNAGSQ